MEKFCGRMRRNFAGILFVFQKIATKLCRKISQDAADAFNQRFLRPSSISLLQYRQFMFLIPNAVFFLFKLTYNIALLNDVFFRSFYKASLCG